MVLVTGGSGLLGSAICKVLDRQGIDYLAPTRADVDWLNTASAHAYLQEHKPKTVLHAAARVHGLMGNMRFPAQIFDENMLINFNLISASHAAGVNKIVAASTVAAYPGHLVVDIKEDQYFDGPPHAGESAYGSAKRAMLNQLEAYKREYGANYAYSIFTNLYGPGDRFDTENGHVVPSLIAKFHEASQKGTPVKVWGKGRAQRDFLFSADAAAAMLHLVDHAEGPVNVASGFTVQISRLVEILSELSGVTDIVWQHDKPEGQILRSYDVTRLRESGFTHSFSLEEGLKTTYDWYAANYQNCRN